MTKIDGIEDVARIFAGGEEWLMECLSCGKNSEHLLCSECCIDAKFADIYQMVMHYSQENCQNEHVKNFVESFENPAMATLIEYWGFPVWQQMKKQISFLIN